MSKTFLTLSLFSVILLSGCGSKTNIPDGGEIVQEVLTISPEAQAEADKRITGNQSCDNYLATLRCIGEKGETTNDFLSQYNALSTSLANIPNEQLEEICTTLSNELQEHPTILLYNAECNTITTVEKTDSSEENL